MLGFWLRKFEMILSKFAHGHYHRPCKIWACMDNRSSWSTQDCSQDSFEGVKVGSEYLKYKIIPDSFNLLSWTEAQKKCEDEGATMWEVMNEEEWNTIYQILRDKNRNIIWINGKSTDECDDPQKVHFSGKSRTVWHCSPEQNNSHCTVILSPYFVHKHKLPLNLW